MMETPSVEALVDAIARVLDDDTLRADLGRRAVARGRALSWSNITRDPLQVVRDAAIA